ncbi:uncharacterized protein LOC120698402 [Panicum virgatum]|uniref:DUF1618 domain-containing protein n=1 Tax=Panicum virgatum TaxID=38727 RepID=A0A8T0V1R7_PANVG|nr:uncharacterized protein LOC120698402 [Panicum virgatum]KAG2626893.1 hypothetical protein PVAP13_3KG484507 [Panicum virgatum]
MQLPLHRAISARLRRGLSAAASCPQWAIIEEAALVKSTSPRASLQLANPPCFSSLLVPAHRIDPLPRLDADPSSVGIFGGGVRATSGDGLLLLQFADGPATPAVVARVRAAPKGEKVRLDIDPDITRLVCNPLSGEMVRLPDIDGTKKVHTWHAHGILTRSARWHGPPDRYAVVELSVDGEGDKRSFVMRRFFSQTGEWDKLVGLPSPLPRPRWIDIDHEVLAFAGRLWWVDLTWGAVSADPFSDRPELRFVELPRASVWPLPGPGPATRTSKFPVQGRYRRMGVSEGRLRYAEVSQKEPFLLSSYALDEDGDGWTLEHQVPLSRIWADAGKQEGTPRIGVIDPLNSRSMCVLMGNHSLAIDMDTSKVVGCSMITGGGPEAFLTAFLKPCVLPPWLESSRIPSSGTLSRNKDNVKSKSLSDILVRVDRVKKN